MANSPVQHICPACNHRWEEDMYYEAGRIWYTTSDGTCPECGEDGEIE